MNNIEAFKARADQDPEFCHQLFEWATIRLLAHKWAYYVNSKYYIEDEGYDGEEKSWYIMGRALGLLAEDETSPCVDWDEKHPLANKAVEYAKTLRFKDVVVDKLK